jgi:hypothetical protein
LIYIQIEIVTTVSNKLSNQNQTHNRYKHIAIKPETYNLLLSEARYSDSMDSVISRVFLAHTKQKQGNADNQLDMPTYTSTSSSNSIDLLELDYQLRKARGEFDGKAKPRIASKEDIQRDRTWNGGIHCPSRY